MPHTARHGSGSTWAGNATDPDSNDSSNDSGSGSPDQNDSNSGSPNDTSNNSSGSIGPSRQTRDTRTAGDAGATITVGSNGSITTTTAEENENANLPGTNFDPTSPVFTDNNVSSTSVDDVTDTVRQIIPVPVSGSFVGALSAGAVALIGIIVAVIALSRDN